jgi:hypothetical protein
MAHRALVRGDNVKAQAFLAVSASVTLWLLLMVGVYASKPHVPIFRERYVFYLEPLFLIAFVGWLGVTRASHSRRYRSLVVVGALLPFVLFFGSFLRHVYEAPSVALWVAARHAITGWPVLLLLAAVCAAATYVLRRRGGSTTIVVAVALYLAASSIAATAIFRTDSREALRSGVGQGRADWIDRAVGSNAHVALLWSGGVADWDRYRVVWENEFFNRSVRAVYHLRGVPFELAETRVEVRDGRVMAGGRAVHAEYVLSDGPVIDGQRVASRPEVGLALYRVDGPVRLAGVAK